MLSTLMLEAAFSQVFFVSRNDGRWANAENVPLALTKIIVIIFTSNTKCYWHQILSVLIQNTNNSIFFFTCTLGHVKKSGIIGALN